MNYTLFFITSKFAINYTQWPSEFTVILPLVVAHRTQLNLVVSDFLFGYDKIIQNFITVHYLRIIANDHTRNNLLFNNNWYNPFTCILI